MQALKMGPETTTGERDVGPRICDEKREYMRQNKSHVGQAAAANPSGTHNNKIEMQALSPR